MDDSRTLPRSVTCNYCHYSTTAAGPTIQCNLCCTDIHVCCSNLPENAAELISQETAGVRWYCLRCRGIADTLLERNRLVRNVIRRYDNLELVVRNLATEVRTAFSHIEEIVTKLSNREDGITALPFLRHA